MSNAIEDPEKMENNNGNIQNGAKQMTYDEAFEKTGQGNFNRFVLFTCGLCLLGVMVESFGVSYAILPVSCDLNLDSNQKGVLSSSTFIGIASSSYFWGYLSDTRGRRGVMLPCLFLSALFSMLSAFSVNFTMFLTMRILTGTCLSASAATVYAYLGELHINERRAAAIAWACIFISFALTAVPAMAWLFLTTHWSYPIPFLNMTFTPWRAYMLTNIIPTIAAGLCLWTLPESPRYLYVKGKTEEATKILYKIYEKNFGKSATELTGIKLYDQQQSSSTPPTFLKSLIDQTLPLFKWPLLFCLMMSFYSQLTIFALSSGFYLWVPNILNNLLQSGLHTKQSVCEALERQSDEIYNSTEFETAEKCNPIISTSVFPVSVAMGLIFAIFYGLIGVVINRLGKKFILTLILVICGLATVAAPLVDEPIAAIILLVISLTSGCSSSVATSVAVDLFPTHLRAMAMCLSLMIGRVGAVLGSNLIGSLIETQCALPFYIIGGNMIICGMITFLWPRVEDVKKQLQTNGTTNY